MSAGWFFPGMWEIKIEPASTLSRAYFKSIAACFNFVWQAEFEAKDVSLKLFDLNSPRVDTSIPCSNNRI